MHYADTACKRCGLIDNYHKLSNRPAYQCRCGAQVYPLANTPFHKSITDLRTWFLASFFIYKYMGGNAYIDTRLLWYTWENKET